MYYLYILKSAKNNKFYIGQTNNLIKRLKEHNTGKSKSTKPSIPWELVYKKEYKTRAEVVQRERYLKSLKKRSYIEELIVAG